MTKCTRCWISTKTLFKHTVRNEEDDTEEVKQVCWNCDFDLINGGDWEEDAGEILVRRAEEDYEYDPIYFPKPSWYK